MGSVGTGSPVIEAMVCRSYQFEQDGNKKNGKRRWWNGDKSGRFRNEVIITSDVILTEKGRGFTYLIVLGLQSMSGLFQHCISTSMSLDFHREFVNSLLEL